MTGDEFFSVFCSFCVRRFFPFVLDTGTLNNFTARLDVLSQALPKTFCRFFLGSSRFVAFRFLWVGGVPLAAFCPPFLRWFRVVGLGISAISCTLASFFLCRLSLGKPGRPACKPPGPCRPFPWPVPPFPSPAGSRRRYGSRERAAG